jgi:nucleotide-binding universal stress UspA family protein
LVLLHVIEEIPVPPSLMLGNDTALINRARRSARRELEKGWDKIENDNVSLSGECRYGSVSDQILRFAKDNKIDTIVMGSRRLKVVSKLKALGSVTRKVSELADCLY